MTNRINTIFKFACVVIFLLSCAGLRAQVKSNDTRRAQAEQRIRELSERLNLTTEQEEKIKAIMKATRGELKVIKESGSAKEEKKAGIIALMQKTDEKVNAILDPSQQERYKAYKAERSAQMKRKMKERKRVTEDMEEEHVF